MLFCHKCGKKMECTKNGLGVRFYTAHVYPGDEYTCKCCNIKVIHSTGNPVYDPEFKIDTIIGYNSNEKCCNTEHLVNEDIDLK